MTSLLYPTDARNMPFDTPPQNGSERVRLTTPGLYVFFCQMHPFMPSAVIVDDPDTPGLDLGDSITLINGITVPRSSDLTTRLLRGFLVLAEPINWQNFAPAGLQEYPTHCHELIFTMRHHGQNRKL